MSYRAFSKNLRFVLYKIKNICLLAKTRMKTQQTNNNFCIFFSRPNSIFRLFMFRHVTMLMFKSIYYSSRQWELRHDKLLGRTDVDLFLWNLQSKKIQCIKHILLLLSDIHVPMLKTTSDHPLLTPNAQGLFNCSSDKQLSMKSMQRKDFIIRTFWGLFIYFLIFISI